MPKKNSRAMNRAQSYLGSKVPSINEFRNQGLPPFMWVALAYPVSTTLTSTAYEGSYQFTTNDVFDPDFTGAGGQPTFFDSWSAMYRRFRVVKCEANLEFINTTGAGLRAVATPSGSSTLVSSLSWAGLVGDRAACLAKPVNDRACTIRKTWSCPDISGVPLQTYLSESDYCGTSSNSPTTRQILSIVTATGGATDATRVIGKLVYYVRFEMAYVQNISASRTITLGEPASVSHPPAAAAAAAAAAVPDTKECARACVLNEGMVQSPAGRASTGCQCCAAGNRL